MVNATFLPKLNLSKIHITPTLPSLKNASLGKALYDRSEVRRQFVTLLTKDSIIVTHMFRWITTLHPTGESVGAERDKNLSFCLALGLRGADCVALACTEIPLLINPDQSPLPAFSTTELHCQAAIERALSKD